MPHYPDHRGQTATIVGRGPSLLDLTPADFLRGPVITINLAAHRVRELDLPNALYLFQKDGCIRHKASARIPLGCKCPKPARMVEPRMPETVILSAAESGRCFARYPRRIVIDVEQEFGCPWHTMSAPIAVRIAHRMGCDTIRMLGFDARHGDTRRVDGRTLVDAPKAGYPEAVEKSRRWADMLGIDLHFMDPLQSA